MLQSLNPQNQSQLIDRSVSILKNGGLIVYPTDTIYGVGCDALNQEAVNKIYQVKERDDKKPMSFICPSLEQIKQFADLNPTQLKILEKNLPGPFTFILKASSNCPKHLQSENETVGIRMPNNQICLELTKKLGAPIITTSINESGQPPLNDPQEINKIFGNQIDLILDGGKLEGTASTIIDLTHSEPKVLRQGKTNLKLAL
jgi:tRNA threonylcarbamoyl adenosine modification protein (Sua5/YciO/YrdC/YwlC family)